MRQAGAVMVPLRGDEDLRLVLEAAERLRVDDPIPVALVGQAHRVLGLVAQASAGIPAAGREGRQPELLFGLEPRTYLRMRPWRHYSPRVRRFRLQVARRSAWNVEPETSNDSRISLPLLADRGLGRGQAGHRCAEGRGADVVQTELVAKGDRSGIAAMLTANSDLQIGPRAPPALDRDPHQFADSLPVQHLEGVVRQDALLHIEAQELGFGIVERPDPDDLRLLARRCR